MSEQETDITVTEVDEIVRGGATRPWSLNEMTVHEVDDMPGIHREVDTVYVPWGAVTPVDELEVLFTIDQRVVDRRDMTLAEVAESVAETIEDDPRLDEYVGWEYVSASAEAANIDDGRTRVRIRWNANGGDE